MKLEEIGFYTLSNSRCKNLSDTSPMMRCEMILTDRCNFHCPYCRGMLPKYQGDMSLDKALFVLGQWCDQELQNVRFSGGEPLVYSELKTLVRYSSDRKIKRIAVSTNGSFPEDDYKLLVDYGVNDFSISLDACCSSFGNKMTGLPDNNIWDHIVSNIRALSKITYTTVGIVLTETNVGQLTDVVSFAHDLGVADIRIISAAQCNMVLKGVKNIPADILAKHPILRYRVDNVLAGRNVREIEPYDSHFCYLAIDDSIVCGDYHFPCIIYMREHGDPIGKVGPNMRAERICWSKSHNTHSDPICQKNCLDVCVAHNNYCGACRGEKHK